MPEPIDARAVGHRDGWDEVDELREDINAALALVDEVAASTENRQLAKVDGRTHSYYCHHWHADCLAARIRRTLTGEETTDAV